MDAIEQAKGYIGDADRAYAEYPNAANIAAQVAMAYAAIAQAEQLGRIADALTAMYPGSETPLSIAEIVKDIALDISGIAMKPVR